MASLNSAPSLVLDGLEVELCLPVGDELSEGEVVLLEMGPLLLQVRQLHVRLVVRKLLLQWIKQIRRVIYSSNIVSANLLRADSFCKTN